jgi:prepilin-type N-terminal cleavage/methylation domain-containing protein
MDKKLKLSIFKNSKGFSLVEVLIAVTIFGVFVAAFLTGQGHNIQDSILIKEELNMRNLAELKLNEVMLDPPEFTESLGASKESKSFDIEGLKNYSYTLTYKKLEIPDFSQLIGVGKDGEEGEEQNNQQGDTNIQKVVMEKMKENIEKMIWQVQVVITNKETGFTYTVSSWITNPKAQVELNLGI